MKLRTLLAVIAAATMTFGMVGTASTASAAPGGWPIQNEPMLCTLQLHPVDTHGVPGAYGVLGGGTCTGLVQLRTYQASGQFVRSCPGGIGGGLTLRQSSDPHHATGVSLSWNSDLLGTLTGAPVQAGLVTTANADGVGVTQPFAQLGLGLGIGATCSSGPNSVTFVFLAPKLVINPIG